MSSSPTFYVTGRSEECITFMQSCSKAKCLSARSFRPNEILPGLFLGREKDVDEYLMESAKKKPQTSSPSSAAALLINACCDDPTANLLDIFDGRGVRAEAEVRLAAADVDGSPESSSSPTYTSGWQDSPAITPIKKASILPKPYLCRREGSDAQEADLRYQVASAPSMESLPPLKSVSFLKDPSQYGDPHSGDVSLHQSPSFMTLTVQHVVAAVAAGHVVRLNLYAEDHPAFPLSDAFPLVTALMEALWILWPSPTSGGNDDESTKGRSEQLLAAMKNRLNERIDDASPTKRGGTGGGRGRGEVKSKSALPSSGDTNSSVAAKCPIVVYCQAGRSRSVSVVLAFMIHLERQLVADRQRTSDETTDADDGGGEEEKSDINGDEIAGEVLNTLCSIVAFRRPVISPNPGFLSQLTRFYEEQLV